jgi:hypothetical protein
MRRVRQDHRELELRLGASISVHRLSSQGIRRPPQTPYGLQPAGKIDLLTSMPANPGLTSGLPRVTADQRDRVGRGASVRALATQC